MGLGVDAGGGNIIVALVSASTRPAQSRCQHPDLTVSLPCSEPTRNPQAPLPRTRGLLGSDSRRPATFACADPSASDAALPPIFCLQMRVPLQAQVQAPLGSNHWLPGTEDASSGALVSQVPALPLVSQFPCPAFPPDCKHLEGSIQTQLSWGPGDCPAAAHGCLWDGGMGEKMSTYSRVTSTRVLQLNTKWPSSLQTGSGPEQTFIQRRNANGQQQVKKP